MLLEKIQSVLAETAVEAEDKRYPQPVPCRLTVPAYTPCGWEKN